MNTGSDIQVQSTTVNRQWVLAERPVDRAVREAERLDILAESPKFAEIGIPALHETAVVLRRR